MAKKHKKRKVDQKIQRDLAIEAGFYDGRFKQRVVPDKKKKSDKLICRIKVSIYESN